MLSSLPQPEPMPAHLVERINASLAAEQAQRATTMSGPALTPLVAASWHRTRRHRTTRLVFAVAGAAAAVVLVAAVGSMMLKSGQNTTVTESAAVARGAAPSSADDKAGTADRAPALAAPEAATPSRVQIGLSGAHYTRTDFVAQARTLGHAPLQPAAAKASGLEPAATAPGLVQCLNAIGVSRAQVVKADIAFYEGQPAVVIVATTDGVPMAYVVGRQCSPTDPAVLRAATPLP